MTRAVRSRMRSLGRDATWSVLDQAISSLGTLVLAIAVGRASDPAGFGGYAAAIAAYGLFLTGSRALVSMPYLMRVTTKPEEARDIGAGVVGAALLSALPASVLIAVVAVVVGGPTAGYLLVLAAAIPPLLVQDAYRFVLQQVRGSRAVTLNDLLWTGVQATLTAMLLVVPGANLPLLHFVAWATGATCAALHAAHRCRFVPTPARGLRYLRATRREGPPLVVESLAIVGSDVTAQFALAAVAGPAALAPVRGALVALGPVNVVNGGLLFLVTPIVLRGGGADRRRLHRTCVLFGLVIGVVALSAAAVLSQLPPEVGRQLLGDSWDGAQAALLPMGLATAAYGMQTAAMLGFRAHRITRATMRLRLVLLPVPAVLAVLGLHLGGFNGGAYGLFVGALITAGVLWWALVRLPARIEKET